MKTIIKVIYNKESEIGIFHIDGGLFIKNRTNNTYYKGLKIYTLTPVGDTRTFYGLEGMELYGSSPSTFKHYDSYSKHELVSIQFVMLKAYVFLNDQLDEAIVNLASKKLLDEIKSKVVITRKHLRFISNYIDSFEEMLEGYKDN